MGEPVTDGQDHGCGVRLRRLLYRRAGARLQQGATLPFPGLPWQVLSGREERLSYVPTASGCACRG